MLSASAHAASRNCTEDEKVSADKALWLNSTDKSAALKRHLPFGKPVSTGETANEQVLVQRDYIVNYDGDLRVPLWTAHRLKAGEGEKGDRINCFREDPRVAAKFQAFSADYDEPLFDQGHLSPNGDFNEINDTAVINSFIMSNMAPQYCQFNRGHWQILEVMVRRWGDSLGTLYVISGSIFDRDNDGARDADTDAWRMKSKKGERIAIPSHFFKIIVHPLGKGSAESIAFLFPHDRTDVEKEVAASYLAEHVVKIANIEKLAGVQFFPNAKTALDETDRGFLWDYGANVPGTLVRDKGCRDRPQGMR